MAMAASVQVLASLQPALMPCFGLMRRNASISRRRNVAAGCDLEENDWDVSRSCVHPVFRKSIVQEAAAVSNRLQIIFASEGNVCRSVIAEAVFNTLVQREGISDLVECTSKATKDYNVGETPDPKAIEVANEHGLELPAQAHSRLFEFTKDIVEADLIVVMDKFSAADVMKQVVLHEVVDKRAVYSHKVRRLGDFCDSRLVGHLQFFFTKCSTLLLLVKVEDIDDPLYGNMDGPEEIELLRQAYEDIRDSCEGLIKYVLQVRQNLQDSETLKAGLSRCISELQTLSWLVPPMLKS